MMPFDGENLSFFERGILQNLKTFSTPKNECVFSSEKSRLRGAK